MSKGRVSLCTFAAAAAMTVAPRVATAAQAPPLAVAMQAAQNVQQVKDELARLKREFDAVTPPPETGAPPQQTPPPPPPPPPPPQTSQAASSKVFNPDISVIGNFIAAGGKNDVSPPPPFQLSEVEVAFQAVIDPYARADFFVSVGPEGAGVEEGYITFTSLPGNLLVKAGRMRAQFGKVNTLHTHAMPSVDRPLVTTNLVGGEEGFADEGMSVAHLVNNPHLFLEFTGEVYRGASDVFQSEARSDLAYLGRARAYHDITESTNIDVGASVAFGKAGVPGEDPLLVSSQSRRLIGIDATFRYRPLRRAIYKRFNLRTELIWNRQDLPDDLTAESFGFYALGEYQFARRWYVGGRLDRSGRQFDSDAIDKGGAVFMTFWPSEFSQVRGQYRYISYFGGLKGNEFLFQLNFSIGAHGAHVF